MLEIRSPVHCASFGNFRVQIVQLVEPQILKKSVKNRRRRRFALKMAKSRIFWILF